MTPADFDVLMNERLAKTAKTLSAKAQEYASTEDRLHNFKKAAAITDETPAQVCVGFMVKHLVSVLDMVEQLAAPGHALIDEKIGDAICYLVLLEALLKELGGKATS